MTELLVRPAEDRDVPKIAALESACFSDPWSAASVHGTFAGPLGYVLIAEQPDGEGNAVPLGYLIASVFEGEGELLRIAAAPSARRRGVGEALLGHMLADRPSAYLAAGRQNEECRSHCFIRKIRLPHRHGKPGRLREAPR